ncbi:dual serine/threonine and tyrosine protein kinase-like [Glandiceps talaboti]
MENRQVQGASSGNMSTGTSVTCPDHSIASFTREFEDFQSMKETLKSAQTTTRSCFKKIINAQSEDKRDILSKSLLSNEDDSAINRVTNKDATILILGQTNCGKSSLANELLGGGILPTSEVPCTSRIVTLQYSEEGYIRIIGKMDEEMQKVALGGRKRISKDFVVVRDEDRSNLEAVQATVEVGLDNPLLKSGVKLVDAPGLSENNALDRVVRECVGGVLQLIIYVIDGNYGIRLEDQRILGSLYDVAPDLSIFYVCNKVEFHQTANEMDRASDEESDEEDVDTQQYSLEKKTRVFQALVENGFINRSEKMESCRNFHAISTREIRKARTGKVRNSMNNNQYLDAFLHMKEDFLYFAGKMLRGHILNATSRLHQAQKHCFDFFVADVLRIGKSNNTKASEVQNMIATLKQEQKKLRKDGEELLAKKRLSITELIHEAVNGVRNDILETARNMKFSPVKIGESVSKNEMTEQLQQQVQRLVVMRVTQAVKDAIAPLIQSLMTVMTEEAAKRLQACDVGSQSTLPELQNVITNITFSVSAPTLSKLLNSTNLSWSVAQNWLAYRYKVMSKKMAMSLAGTKVDAEWRESVAIDTLKILTPQDMTEVVYREIGNRIDQFYSNLDQNLERIRSLNEISKRQEEKSKQTAKAISLSLCGSICQIEALENRIKHREIIPTKSGVRSSGTRTDVFILQQECIGKFKGTALRIPKQRTQINITDDLAEAIAKTRHLPRNLLIVPVRAIVDVILEGERRMGVMVPVRSSLWTELNPEGSLKDETLEIRLSIARGIAAGCQFLALQGFPAPDLRITNVLLSRPHSKELYPQINTLKLRDDMVPYPDGKPPFHIASERYSGVHQTTGISAHNDAHNVYAFGILLWMLILGEYRRPFYAMTGNFEEIKSAVTRKQSPNINRIHKDFQEHLEKCWSSLPNFRPSWEDIRKWFEPPKTKFEQLHEEYSVKDATQLLGPRDQQATNTVVGMGSGEHRRSSPSMISEPREHSNKQGEAIKDSGIDPSDVHFDLPNECDREKRIVATGVAHHKQRSKGKARETRPAPTEQTSNTPVDIVHVSDTQLSTEPVKSHRKEDRGISSFTGTTGQALRPPHNVYDDRTRSDTPKRRGDKSKQRRAKGTPSPTSSEQPLVCESVGEVWTPNTGPTTESQEQSRKPRVKPRSPDKTKIRDKDKKRERQETTV